jgi:hypothetical protein
LPVFNLPLFSDLFPSDLDLIAQPRQTELKKC